MALTFVASLDDTLACLALEMLSRQPNVEVCTISPNSRSQLPTSWVAVFTAQEGRFAKRHLRVVNLERDREGRGIVAPAWASACSQAVAVRKHPKAHANFPRAVADIPTHLRTTAKARAQKAESSSAAV